MRPVWGWCFCVFPVEPDLDIIWFGYEVATQRRTARYKEFVLYFDNSDKATQVRTRLQGTLELQRDEYGCIGIPYTDQSWNELIDVGRFI